MGRSRGVTFIWGIPIRQHELNILGYTSFADLFEEELYPICIDICHRNANDNGLDNGKNLTHSPTYMVLKEMHYELLHPYKQQNNFPLPPTQKEILEFKEYLDSLNLSDKEYGMYVVYSEDC